MSPRPRLRIGRRREKAPRPAPFVVGVSRSGTTLLRLMLDAHPQLAIPPETHFAPHLIKAARRDDATPERLVELLVAHRRWGDFGLDPKALRDRLERRGPLTAASALRAFYELYAEGQGKPRWGDKTPNYMQSMRLIQRTLPEARFVHLIRDGRDAALSRAARALEEPAPMRAQARRWKRRIVKARRQARRLDHYLELRYEDLVRDPEPALLRICALVELPWDDAMLRHHERAADRLREIDRDLPAAGAKTLRPAQERMEGHRHAGEPPRRDRLERWRREMSPEDRASFEEVAGELLAELGYDTAATAPSAAASRGPGGTQTS